MVTLVLVERPRKLVTVNLILNTDPGGMALEGILHFITLAALIAVICSVIFCNALGFPGLPLMGKISQV
eukprot:CAMPEP_0181262210 /NCGR_PEP_ID=MMETSP1097-20121128/1905_1 /TAXON_ID=35684 /ORGANISM="Pseudopedinella elastica, Strain CCMP716" /LENGTH=68 /DNA_ID=CAMNT_0023360875 /DNA_START=177 /DNA_END=383 /DNA_ORIENTATION=+